MRIEDCFGHRYSFNYSIDKDSAFIVNKAFARKVGVIQSFIFSVFVESFNDSMSTGVGSEERNSKIYTAISLNYIFRQIAPFINRNENPDIPGKIWCNIKDLEDLGVIDILEDYVYGDTILYVSINPNRVNELCGKSKSSIYDRFVFI